MEERVLKAGSCANICARTHFLKAEVVPMTPDEQGSRFGWTHLGLVNEQPQERGHQLGAARWPLLVKVGFGQRLP